MLKILISAILIPKLFMPKMFVLRVFILSKIYLLANTSIRFICSKKPHVKGIYCAKNACIGNIFGIGIYNVSAYIGNINAVKRLKIYL